MPNDVKENAKLSLITTTVGFTLLGPLGGIPGALLAWGSVAASNKRANDNIRQGCQFHHSGQYQQAFEAFKRAVDEESAEAYRHLGVMYQSGQYVSQSYINAARCYRQAMQRGYAKAQEDMNRMYLRADLPAEASNGIGWLYLHGDGVDQSYTRALLWCKKSSEQGYAAAFRNMGFIYEYGHVSPNLLLAASYYRTAIEKGYAQAIDDLNRVYRVAPSKLSKPALKKFERDRLVWAFKQRPHTFLTDADHENKTALHRAAEHGLLKQCARLLVMGANTSREDIYHNKPLTYVIRRGELRKTNDLASKFCKLMNALSKPATEVLANATNIQGNQIVTEDIRLALEDIYQIEEIKPIMELAKLAVLGLHVLSNRPCFVDGYDSDNDSSEATPITQKLIINIDANKTTVENLCLWGDEGIDGYEAWGTYWHNLISVGGRNIGSHARSSADIRAALIHELTHFAVHEVFLNNGSPYSSHNDVNRNQFEVLTNELYERQGLLDSILRDAFAYKQADWHGELLVRVAEILVTYNEVSIAPGVIGRERLQREAPQLFNYYNTVFLNAVKAHIPLLRQRALKGWPEDMLRHNHRPDSPFQLRN